MYCFNLGFVGPCPYERLCRKDKELDDLARKGKIERPGIEALDYSSKSTGSLKGRKSNLEDLITTRKRKLERARRGYEELGGDPDRIGINKTGGIYIKRK
jgi:hypothetical protein